MAKRFQTRRFAMKLIEPIDNTCGHYRLSKDILLELINFLNVWPSKSYWYCIMLIFVFTNWWHCSYHYIYVSFPVYRFYSLLIFHPEYTRLVVDNGCTKHLTTYWWTHLNDMLTQLLVCTLGTSIRMVLRYFLTKMVIHYFVLNFLMHVIMLPLSVKLHLVV